MAEKTNILVIHYSQSGQLARVARSFVAPLLQNPAFAVTFEELKPATAFPFPWPFFRFLDTFPEAVYLDAPPLQPSALRGDEEFDLVILAYQVWFLSPSLPTTAFLQSELAQKLLRGKKVVTLIACRNMWLMAQEEVKGMLKKLGAQLVGNVALVDEAGSAGSFLATPVWVLSGQRGPHLGGLIPRAGVSERDIEACSRFGDRIAERVGAGGPMDETLLQGLGAVNVNEKLISSEKTARRGFRIWGRLFRLLGPQGSFQRKPLILFYATFLITFILTFIPVSVLLKSLLAPLARKRIAQQKTYYGAPSGS